MLLVYSFISSQSSSVCAYREFNGFASQEGSTNAVEDHLFNALKKTCLIEDRDSAQYSRCGRTDSGVSAFGKVVSLVVRSALKNHKGLISPQDRQKAKEATATMTMMPTTTEPESESAESKLTTKSNFENETEELAPVEGELDYCTILNRFVIFTDYFIILYYRIHTHK